MGDLPAQGRTLPARALAALTVVVVLALAGCGGAGPDPDGDGEGGGAAGAVSGQVTVFAAASLTEAFEELAAGFTAAHPDAEVRYNFAGSQALAGQIEQGAPADVFASADTRTMDRVAEAGLLDGEPQVFAHNQLQIVVSAGNPHGVSGLEDLARPGLKVVLAAEEVPVGAYGREALGRAGVQVEPVSLENDVKAVVTKVALGEADAGIVYATDVTAEGDKVEGVPIPEEHNVAASYPVAVTADAANPRAARAFVDHLLSEGGQATLQEHGFLPPAS